MTCKEFLHHIRKLEQIQVSVSQLTVHVHGFNPFPTFHDNCHLFNYLHIHFGSLYYKQNGSREQSDQVSYCL